MVTIGGLFGVVSKEECIHDLFYGTDYHMHLGTKRGGLATNNRGEIIRFIHSIENDYFRSKFESDYPRLKGNKGIGAISDTDDQPITQKSHMGQYAIVTVGRIFNQDEILRYLFSKGKDLSVLRNGSMNPTEITAKLINTGGSIEEGIEIAQNMIKGSCSMAVMTDRGIYAARDRLGRTPLVTGIKEGSVAVASETCSFPNLGYEIERFLGPGEVRYLTPHGSEQVKKPDGNMQICAFLWVYYGYPASKYENIQVEPARNSCGAKLAIKDDVDIDMVAGIPDSGIGHGIGYANQKKIPYLRPFVKYTPTWPRSFMPQNQDQRDLVARMKLIPVDELIKGKRILFCEDSIVRGTQLQDTIQELYDKGALEVHMRPACPTLIYSCDFLNFSVSKSVMDLAGRKSIREIEGDDISDLSRYAMPGSEENKAMIERTRQRLMLTTLRYQELPDLVDAIGLPKEDLCTHCWDGTSHF